MKVGFEMLQKIGILKSPQIHERVDLLGLQPCKANHVRTTRESSGSRQGVSSILVAVFEDLDVETSEVTCIERDFGVRIARDDLLPLRLKCFRQRIFSRDFNFSNEETIFFPFQKDTPRWVANSLKLSVVKGIQ